MRLLVFLIVAVILAAGAGWLAMDPGLVRITLRGWQIETSPGIAAAAIVALVVLSIALYSLLAWLLGAPGRLRRWQGRRRESHGLAALSQGMVAVAAGDVAGARKAARRAKAALHLTPLTLLLSAQAAQLDGDDGAAEKWFREMLNRPETEFLGLRGLLIQAGRAGDEGRALAYAERAAQLRPKSAWVQQSLLELAVKAGLWAEAESALKKAKRGHSIDPATADRHLAVILMQQSIDSEKRGFPVEARNLARRAFKAGPGLAPVALRLAELERAAGHEKKARRLLEKAWSNRPHPDIAAAHRDFAAGEGDSLALDRVRLAERLVKASPDHPESHLACARAALDARLWGDARRHLRRAENLFEAAGESPPARFWRLRAAIESGESDDPLAGAEFLARAGDAPADPHWICDACGAPAQDWSAFCGRCQAFDSLRWRRPDMAMVLAEPQTAPSVLLGPKNELGNGPPPPKAG